MDMKPSTLVRIQTAQHATFAMNPIDAWSAADQFIANMPEYVRRELEIADRRWEQEHDPLVTSSRRR